MLNMIADAYAIRRSCIEHDPAYTNHARHLLDQSLRLHVMAERWLEPPVPRDCQLPYNQSYKAPDKLSNQNHDNIAECV